MSGKDDLVNYFKENQELFEEIIQDIKDNDYPEDIYGAWVSRSPDEKYFIYYEDTGSECIRALFESKDWYLNNIISVSEENELRDKGIIFMQCESAGYNYWGVYYVEDDELIGWEGLKHFKPTERKGNGYYLNKNGCQYYTERICENWCFF